MQRIFQKKDFMELVANASKTKVEITKMTVLDGKISPGRYPNANAKVE